MDVTSAQVQKILTGSQNFSMLSFSMLITRLKGIYAKDNSKANLERCASEVTVFIKKYGVAMKADMAIISKL